MAPDRSVAAGTRARRRRPLRSRVPLHRRIRQDPAAVRHWALVTALAVALAWVVTSAIDEAAAERDRWGRTAPVWVATRPVRAGDPLTDAVRAQHWPTSLIPPAALRQAPGEQRAAVPIDDGAALTRTMVERTRTTRRAVAVPLPAAHLPVDEGDRVDVWATPGPSEIEGTGTAAPTRRVAVDARVVRPGDGSVVLSVEPGEVAAVAGAAATATITLVGVG